MGDLDGLIKKWEREGYKKAELETRHPVSRRIYHKLRHSRIVPAIKLGLLVFLIWLSMLLVGAWLRQGGDAVEEGGVLYSDLTGRRDGLSAAEKKMLMDRLKGQGEVSSGDLAKRWDNLDASAKKMLINQFGEEKLKGI
jgi:hypothetical protein